MTTGDNSSPASPAKTAMVDSLGERFTSLWGRCLRPGSRDDGAAAVWRDVASRYGEPHRHYHGTRHLAHILRQFDLVADRLARPDQVEVALWFHDVIVQPGQRDNEERSAAYFRETANGRMAPDFVEGVVDLILHTTHRGAPRDADHRYICDIDLSTFGSPWGEFLDNSAAIKAEFQGPESDYYRAEQGFLESLLARQRIFLTDFFHDRYEARARDNIRRFISLLEQAQPA